MNTDKTKSEMRKLLLEWTKFFRPEGLLLNMEPTLDKTRLLLEKTGPVQLHCQLCGHPFTSTAAVLAHEVNCRQKRKCEYERTRKLEELVKIEEETIAEIKRLNNTRRFPWRA